MLWNLWRHFGRVWSSNGEYFSATLWTRCYSFFRSLGDYIVKGPPKPSFWKWFVETVYRMHDRWLVISRSRMFIAINKWSTRKLDRKFSKAVCIKRGQVGSFQICFYEHKVKKQGENQEYIRVLQIKVIKFNTLIMTHQFYGYPRKVNIIDWSRYCQ